MTTKVDAEFDYSEYVTAPAEDGDALSQMRALGQQLRDAEEELEDLKSRQTTVQQRIKDIREFKLPELMETAGVTDFGMSDGKRVQMDVHYRGNVTEGNREAVIEWLESDEGQGGSLVRRTFEIAFGKQDQAWANKFASDLARRKRPLPTVVKKTVATNSLVAHVKRMLEAGKEVDLTKLGIYRQRLAKVT